jgi:hypothetical protein
MCGCFLSYEGIDLGVRVPSFASQEKIKHLETLFEETKAKNL